MSKKYKVRVSIPVEYDISDLMTSFDTTIDVEADNYEKAVSIAKTEFNDNYDLDSIYDEIYEAVKTNMLVWLDGDYECDTYDDDYYFAEEQQPKQKYLTSTGVDDDKGVEVDE